MPRIARAALIAGVALLGFLATARTAQAQPDFSLEQRVAILCSADMFRAHLEAVDVIEGAAVIAVQALGVVADAGADASALIATADHVSQVIARYTETATGFIDRIADHCVAFLAALEAHPAIADQVRTVQSQVVALVRGANERAQVEISAELNRLLATLP